jgi:hypothetical protein
LGPIDRADLYLQTPESTPDRIYKSNINQQQEFGQASKTPHMRPSTYGHASFNGQSIVYRCIKSEASQKYRYKYQRLKFK